MSKGREGGSGILSGILWTGILRWVAQTMAWGSTLILVRLLTPADYGIAGLATTISNWLSMVADFGISNAILTGDEKSERDAGIYWTFSVLLGCAAALLLAACGGLFASAFREPELAAVVRLLALALVAETVRSVPNALMSRQRRYREIANIELARGIVQTSAVLGLALVGFRFWSLAVGYVAGAIVAAVFTVRVCGLRPRSPRVERGSTLLTRARLFFLGTVSWQTYRNTDSWIIGRVLGSAPLGSYTVARSLASIPIEKLVTIVTSVSPGYLVAARSDKPQLRRLFLDLTEAVLIVVTLPLVGLAMTSDIAVPVLLGPSWNAVVEPLRFLCASMVLWASAMVAAQVASMSDGLRITAIAGVVAVPVSIVAYWIGARWFDVTGIAAANILVVSVTAIPSLYAAMRATDCTVSELLRSLKTTMLAAGAMAVLVAITRRLSQGLGPTAELLMAASVGAVTALVIVARSQSSIILRIRSGLPSPSQLIARMAGTPKQQSQ